MFNKLKAMFMERDGVTPCFVRIATVIGQSGYFGITAIALKHGQPIDFVMWAGGYTALVVGGAGGALLKLKTEDQKDVGSSS